MLRNIAIRYGSLTAMAAVLLVSAVCLSGCGAESDSDADNLTIVATTGMLGDAVKKIAGDNLTVHTLMGPGVDPHMYRATKSDLDKLGKANAIFYNGLHLEAKLAEILEKMESQKTVVAAGKVLADSLLRYPEEAEGYPDPHVWFDLALWQRVVEGIGSQLALVDPQNADVYAAATKAHSDSIAALDAWVREQISTIPEDRRVLITAHDAFGYFGDAYDIEVIGLQGISTVNEAGLYDVTSLVDLIVKRKIKAVFVESSVSPKAIQAVVDGCRSKGHEVVIGGELFSDAMGEPGTPEGTYFGMVRHNVNAIAGALR